MFTGIVSDVGTLVAVKDKGEVRRLRVASKYPARSIALGASIAFDGICLTVVAKGARGKGSWIEVEVGLETMARTTAGKWAKGKKLNLERAVKVGDELGGHLVSGHVDGLAELVARDDIDQMARLRFRAPKELARFIAPKGSVTLDGISLTVNEVSGSEFGVFIIPHTLAATHWHSLQAGAAVNLEVDLVARYLARLAEAR
ncbi:MAG: riboflavin synthase [Bradyrhizobiaceae bacterium]|nr:riboflavin synthase [Bradyrhizobiaceae bacterium]